MSASRRCDDPLKRGCVEIIVHPGGRGRPQETCAACKALMNIPPRQILGGSTLGPHLTRHKAIAWPPK